MRSAYSSFWHQPPFRAEGFAQESTYEETERRAFMRSAIANQNVERDAIFKQAFQGKELPHLIVTQLVPFVDWDFYNVTSNREGIVCP